MNLKLITHLSKIRLSLFSLSMLYFSLSAQNKIWVGPVSGGDWATASNWNGNAVPIASDSVFIGSPNVVTISTAVGVINKLSLKGALTISATGTLNIINSIRTNSLLDIAGGSVSNAGTVNLQVNTSCDATGLNFISGTIADASFTNTASGTLSVNTSVGTGECICFNQATGGNAYFNAGNGGATLTPGAGKIVFYHVAGNAQVGGAIAIGNSSSFMNCKTISMAGGNLTLLPSANISAYVSFTSANISLGAASGLTTSLTNNGTFAIHLPPTGATASLFQLSPSAGALSTTLSNAGTITVDGVLGGTSGIFAFQGGDATQQMIINNTGAITDTHTGSASVYSFSSTTANRVGIINNFGTLSLSSTMNLGSAVSINNKSGGCLNVKAAITGNSFGGVTSTINNYVGAIFNGDVSANTSALLSGTMNFNNYGLLTGRGSIAATVVFNPQKGTIAPGNASAAIGQFTFATAYAIDFTGSNFFVKVNGKTASAGTAYSGGIDYDQILFSAAAANITLSNAVFNVGGTYTPTINENSTLSFLRLNAATPTGVITGLPAAATGNKGWTTANSSANTFIFGNFSLTALAKVPTVISSTPSILTASSALFNGNLTSNGGATITARGFCYKTVTGVSLSDNNTVEGGTSTGVYSKTISALSPNTQYFYKAYATNSSGSSLSTTELSFYTLANPPTAPVLNASPSTLSIAIGSGDGNPSSTTYKVMINGQYVQVDGTLGATQFCQTATNWGVKSVVGIIENTTYTLQVIALNGAGVETTSASSFVLPVVTPTIGAYTANGLPQGPNSASNSGSGSTYTYRYASQDDITYPASSTPPTAAGDYYVTVSVAPNGNYVSASSAATSFAISPIFVPLAQLPECSMSGLSINYKSDPSTTTYNQGATRTICQLSGFSESTPSVPINKYGSRTDQQTTATGYFYVKLINGRWWVVDPLGYLNITKGPAILATSGGASSIAALNSLYGGNKAKWLTSTKQILKDLGFFAAGGWSDVTTIVNNPDQSTKPLAYSVMLGLLNGYSTQRYGISLNSTSTTMPVFDSQFPLYCDSVCRSIVANSTDKNLFGYFTDNELPFAINNLNYFLAIGRTSPTDQNYLATKSWLAANGRTAADTLNDVIRSQFLAYVATTYYSTVYNAIKRHDSNHMVIGSRVCQTPTRNNSYFMTAVGPYVDLFSANYYSAWTPPLTDSQNWAAQLGKPYLVSEFYTKGADVGQANIDGAGFIVPTQTDRGYEYQNFTLGLLESKACVGWHWFRYMDNDSTTQAITPTAPNFGSNKGIVNTAYALYTPLTDLMKELNLKVYNLVDYFDQQPTPATIYPEADAYYAGTTCYGTVDRLGIENCSPTSSSYREAFLRFNLVGQTPQIGPATLHLSVLSAAPAGRSYKAEVCGDTWTETNVTSTVHPAATSVIGNWVGSVDPNMDVKSTLISKINAGNTKLSIKLSGVTTSATALEFASRENTSVAMRPHIDIMPDGPATATNLIDLFIQNYRLSNFNPDSLTYKISLPANTTANPTIQYTLPNSAMTVVLTNPVNVLSSSVSDRTAKLTTTSGNGLQHRTYTIVFDDLTPQVITDLKKMSVVKGISCYPNPVNGNSVLTVLNHTLELKNNLLQITDLSGKVLFKTLFTGSEYQLKFPELGPGMYLIQVNNLKGRFVHKLMLL